MRKREVRDRRGRREKRGEREGEKEAQGGNVFRMSKAQRPLRILKSSLLHGAPREGQMCLEDDGFSGAARQVQAAPSCMQRPQHVLMNANGK